MWPAMVLKGEQRKRKEREEDQMSSDRRYVTRYVCPSLFIRFLSLFFLFSYTSYITFYHRNHSREGKDRGLR